MNSQLRRAVEIVAQKDAGAFRQQVFAELASRKPVIRFVMQIHALLGRGFLSTLFICCYGIKSFLAVAMPKSGCPLLAVAMYRNERRQLDHLADGLGQEQMGRAHLGLAALCRPGGYLALIRGFMNGSLVRQCYGLIAEHNSKGNFLVACRVASTVCYFCRFNAALAGMELKAALVCSDSNPYAMGLSYAARQHGLKTLYINHGHIPQAPPALDFDLSILDGPALLDVYREVAPEQGRVIFKGVEGAYRPLALASLSEPNITIGVFTSLIVDWQRFKEVLDALKRHLRPKQILLRLHPNRVIRDTAALGWLKKDPQIQVSDGNQILTQDAQNCDLVIVGNSSCHLTLLRFGVPTLYVPGLDSVPHDFYRFLALGVVPEFADVSAIDLNELARFYSNGGWEERFARFDAAYPDKLLTNQVRDAIMAVIHG